MVTKTGRDTVNVTVAIEPAGAFTLSLDDGRSADGTWAFHDGELSVDFRGELYRYTGLDGDNGELDVYQDREPESGKFDYFVESEDHVVLIQTEWFNGQPTSEDDVTPLRFDCRRTAV